MYTKLARNLRFLRKKKGLSQAALAENLGLNRGNIASYEKGIAEPNLSNLLNMVRFFEVDIIDFIAREISDDTESADQGPGSNASKPAYENMSAEVRALCQESAQFEAILKGQKEYHQRKLQSDYRLLQEKGKKIFHEYERLLEVSEEIMALNRRLIMHLRQKE